MPPRNDPGRERPLEKTPEPKTPEALAPRGMEVASEASSEKILTSPKSETLMSQVSLEVDELPMGGGRGG